MIAGAVGGSMASGGDRRESVKAVFSLVGGDVVAKAETMQELQQAAKEQLATRVVRNMSFKARTWHFLREPRSSRKAFRFASAILLLIFLNTLFMLLETVPGLKSHLWFRFEIASVVVYSIELGAKLWSCPTFRVFWDDPLNVVDVVAVVPSYIEFVVVLAGGATRVGALRVFRLLRFFRIFRVFQFNAVQQALDDFVGVLQKSSDELLLLTGLMCMVILIWGTAMHYLEGSTRGAKFTTGTNPFSGGFAGNYWTLQTLTGVGYGDIVPASTIAIAVACFTVLNGAILISLPITAINNKFVELRESRMEHAKLQDKRHDVALQQRKLLAQYKADVSLGLDELVTLYKQQDVPTPYPIRTRGFNEIDTAAAKKVSDMIEETDRRMNEQMDMLMNVCLQAYQRFGQTLGKQQLEKSTSFRLSKMTSMRSMRELFDDAAERGISRANTMSPTESTRPLASRRKEADIIQTTDKSMDDLLGASARIAGLQSANRKQNTDMDAADDLAQKKQRNQSKRFFA